MDKTFKVDILSPKSIENLKKELMRYKNDLPSKCEEYIRELSRMGVVVAETRINESPLGKYVTISTEISSEKMGCRAILIAVGAVKEVEGREPFNTLLAIEFGAGIYYNPIPNPNADKLGFGVGSYPGQLHAFEDGWYYWDDDSQEWKYTHGVKATMPMHNADIEIITNYVSLAKKIFGK